MSDTVYGACAKCGQNLVTCGCHNQTSPPPSETGPSPEATSAKLPETQSIESAVQALMDAIWPNHCHEHDLNGHDCGDRISEEAARAWIRDALLAAKRLAHLEDARAGCEWCACDDGGMNATPERRDGWKGWWHRGGVAGSQRNFFKCSRPEVWEALSLLPPKGTK